MVEKNFSNGLKLRVQFEDYFNLGFHIDHLKKYVAIHLPFCVVEFGYGMDKACYCHTVYDTQGNPLWVMSYTEIPSEQIQRIKRNWNYLIQNPHSSTCKVCGYATGLDFLVPNATWDSIVPLEFRNLVICLHCFDKFAGEADMDYEDKIINFWFAGHNSFELRKVE
jgi:hypothetical protein